MRGGLKRKIETYAGAPGVSLWVIGEWWAFMSPFGSSACAAVSYFKETSGNYLLHAHMEGEAGRS